MIETMKKAVLAGVGMAVLTKEKAEQVAREMAESLQLSGDKGKEFVDDLMNQSDKARKDLEVVIERAVTETLKKMNVPTGDDVTKLNQRLDDIEKQLESKPE
jgi:polyhydroxyalkanoate synthesis regulator phasin